MKNCKKYLIADALLNYSKNSITEFIETSKDSELSKIAGEKGIILPSPDLMLFRTIYAKIGEPNRNGVIINREPVEKSLKTLVAKQINLEHEGKNFVCGHVLDAKIENEYIVIYGVFYKSLFQEEYRILKDLFTDKKVYVSFEIWSKDPETGNSVMHDLENGIREINPIIFHGAGLLMQHLPACKEAILDKILGQKLLENAEKIVDKVFNEDLICASLAIEEPKCMNCKNCTYEKDKEELKVAEENLIEVEETEFALLEEDYNGGEIEDAKKLKYEERQKLSDDDFAVVVTVKNKITGEPRKIRMFPIQDESHVRNALARLPQAAETLKKLGISQEEVLKKILKRAKELNMTELLKKYEKAEDAQVTPEPAQVTEPAPIEQKPEEKAQVAEQPAQEKEKPIRTTSYYTSENIESIGEDGGIDYQSKIYEKIIRVYKDGREEIEIREGNSVNDSKISKYTSAQLETKVNASIDEIIATFPKEVADCVKGKIKDGKKPAEAVKECWKEYKDKQSKAMADEVGKKDKEISNLKTELDAKVQEIAELKTPKVVEAKEEPTIEVGNVETKDNDPIKKQAESINEIIASKHKGKQKT